MTLERRGRVKSIALAILVGIACSGGAPPAALGDSLRVALEPGLLLPSGEAILPIRITDHLGMPRRALESALALEIEGARVASFQVAMPPTRIAVVVDPSAIAESERSAWAEEIARADAPGSAGGTRVFLCGRRLREVTGAPAAGVEAALREGADASLFDGVLEAIRRLSSESSSLERRCVVVVGSGVEARESRHPVVTCIGAADTARVAVYAVVLPAREGAAAGDARLRELASRSGGTWRAGPSTAGSSAALVLASTLARVREIEAIRIAAVPGNVQGRVAVRVTAPQATPATGSLAPRASLGFEEGGGFPWGMLALGGGLFGGAAAFAFARTRPRGRLVVVRGSRPQEIVVRRGGVTIGSATGNRLVLEDPGISRHHAVVQVRSGRVTFVDLKSTNGTRVNGARITAKPLSDGDRILLAEAVELVYQRGPWAGSVKSRALESEKTGQGTKTARSQRLDDHDDDADE